MAATIRFQALVARSGRPDVYTPWSDPLRDKVFQKARKENRVLTVHQNLHGAKDYGEVGFREGRGLQFLIFPKSLRWAEGKRVVGIRYDQIAEAKFPAAPLAQATNQAKAKKKAKPLEKKAEPVVVEPEPMAEPPEPVEMDPLTKQLKEVLRDLEKSRVPKARATLRKIIQQREKTL